ncbi:MAG: hypothetical protein WCJ93_01570 [Methanomicrobiales archaeon]
MKTLLLFLVMALVIAASGTVSASQGTTLTISPPGVTLQPGSTVTYELSINTLPAGLSGYQLDFLLTNSAVGNITSVSFPAWAKLGKTSSLPAGRVTISAADIGKSVEDEASGTTLARITVVGVAAGTSNIKLQNIRIDDDHGGYINPDTPTAQLVVKPSGISGNSAVTAVITSSTPAVVATLVPTPLPTAAETPVELSVTSNIPVPDAGATATTAMPASPFAKIPRWIFYALGLIALVAGLSLLFLAVTRRI